MSFTSINRVIPKIGASELAKGIRLFCDDIKVDDCLVLKVKRSDRPHARVVGIDSSDA